MELLSYYMRIVFFAVILGTVFAVFILVPLGLEQSLPQERVEIIVEDARYRERSFYVPSEYTVVVRESSTGLLFHVTGENTYYLYRDKIGEQFPATAYMLGDGIWRIQLPRDYGESWRIDADYKKTRKNGGNVNGRKWFERSESNRYQEGTV